MMYPTDYIRNAFIKRVSVEVMAGLASGSPDINGDIVAAKAVRWAQFLAAALESEGISLG
jgi:hypothetical protein